MRDDRARHARRSGSLATETVIGNYRIKERIGRGGMGVVYRGQHLQLPREVAIKFINAGDGRDLRRLRERFKKEAYIQSQLDHPGIVKIYDYIVAEQTYYIIMEYVQGRSLAQLCASEECPLELSRALDIFEQVLKAVAYAHGFVYLDQGGSTHRGLIHRDLKPANILIAPGDRVKITDFGIVKLVGAENTDTFGGTYGSPQYVSPEQAEGNPVDQRSDIYSLGILLYEMLTGDPPFGGAKENLSRTEILRAHVERQPLPPSRLNDKITPGIEAAIMRALEKKPGRRFATATEFLRALRHAQEGRDTGDLRRPEVTQPQIRQGAGAEEIYGPMESLTARQSYVTQLIGTPACGACGAESRPGDEHCRECGRELSASPATVKLAQQEAAEWQKKRARGLWTAVTLAALAVLSVTGFYLLRDGKETHISPPPPPPPSASPAPTHFPDSALIELKPARIEVDSSFDGYSAAPLADGETDVRRIARMRYNRGNWASAETHSPHWIELAFDHPASVAAVYVYWGFDHNRFHPSRRVELQVPDDNGGWRTLSLMEPGDDYDRTAFEFTPQTTTRLRILQPAQQGPAHRPFMMWVRAVKVFSVAPASP